MGNFLIRLLYVALPVKTVEADLAAALCSNFMVSLLAYAAYGDALEFSMSS